MFTELKTKVGYINIERDRRSVSRVSGKLTTADRKLLFKNPPLQPTWVGFGPFTHISSNRTGGNELKLH